ncbi:MAG: hypothetical protein WKG07_18170 [Hymenobacter sp.]
MTKSLKATGNQFADSAFQLTVLRQEVVDVLHLPPFQQKMRERRLVSAAGRWPRRCCKSTWARCATRCAGTATWTPAPTARKS